MLLNNPAFLKNQGTNFLLCKKTVIRGNISISSSNIRIEKPPISNFRQPFPRSYANSENRDTKNVQQPNISENRSFLSRLEPYKDKINPSFNISMSMNNRITISQTPKNSIPKPSFNSIARQLHARYLLFRNLPPPQFKKSATFQKNSKLNITSECAAHSIDSSKLPLGNIGTFLLTYYLEKMLTPIQKPKNLSANLNVGGLRLTDQKLSQTTQPALNSKHTEKRKTEDIIKFSQIELGRIKDLNENIDPNMLEKLGDQTLAECFAILQNTTLS
ncbi:hypothetical protein MXB_5356 [Myxobolus squamalis]|nr:hypothetical protein MXB_5356 [Myxobolus squamalis]